MHSVYIVRCRDDVPYLGETSDLSFRFDKHREGSACSFTASRRPVTLVYAEEWPTKASVLARERQLKRWTRAKKEALIAGHLTLRKRL